MVYPGLHGWSEGLTKSTWHLEAVSLQFYWVYYCDQVQSSDTIKFTAVDMLSILRGGHLEWV
jgi:hypothetical protein